MSIFYCDFETLQKLLEEKKANAGDEMLKEYVNSRDIYNRTPLHMHSYGMSVEALINAGADVYAQKDGETPLRWPKDERAIEALINAVRVKGGIKEVYDYVNTRDNTNYNCTPLHWQKDGRAVKALIKAGADVNARNGYNSTPLHWCKDEEAIEALLTAGANINAKNDGDTTPLDDPYIFKVYRNVMVKRLQKFCKKNFRYFVFKHWIKSLEGAEWLYHPKRGGKYIQKKMLVDLGKIKQ